jgi:hypothetical protein
MRRLHHEHELRSSVVWQVGMRPIDKNYKTENKWHVKAEEISIILEVAANPRSSISLKSRLL